MYNERTWNKFLAAPHQMHSTMHLMHPNYVLQLLRISLTNIHCWLLLKNQSFYRQIASYDMGVRDHRLGR